jgi:hypothetical protein
MSLDHAPTFIDARLDWLIAASGITNPSPRRRLNAIENQLANLASRWRPLAPIDPERELRMSAVTRDQLVAWVEECEVASDETMERLAIYASGVNTGIELRTFTGENCALGRGRAGQDAVASLARDRDGRRGSCPAGGRAVPSARWSSAWFFMR